MYLTYAEYVSMGGTLDNSAFSTLEISAEYLINSQSGGKTGERISNLSEIPNCIKDCVFQLINLAEVNPINKTVSSESQSSGGVSESYSYTVLTKEQYEAQQEGTIYNCLFGGGYGKLLYMGCGE